MEMPAGERFARAVADRDASALLDLFAPDIDFRALTPSKFWEAASAAELVNDVILGQWFESTDRIEAVEAVENDVVVDRQRVGYRYRVVNDDGTFIVEQQAYLGVEDGQINWLRIVCSGYRPIEASAP